MQILAHSYFRTRTYLKSAVGGLALAIGAMAASSTALSQTAPWSGVYVGVHGGYGAANWDGLLYSSSFVDSPEYGFDPDAVRITGEGWLGGIQIGLNQQFDSLVVGIELDFTTLGIAGAGAYVNIPESHQWDITNTLDWMSTARVRVGYGGADFMVYATGGLAVARTTSALEVTHLSPPGGPVQSATGSARERHIGYALGAGVEWRLAPNLSVRGEYLYANLGHADYNLHGTLTSNGAAHLSDAFPADLTVHSLRFGINYIFGGR